MGNTVQLLYNLKQYILNFFIEKIKLFAKDYKDFEIFSLSVFVKCMQTWTVYFTTFLRQFAAISWKLEHILKKILIFITLNCCLKRVYNLGFQIASVQILDVLFEMYW